VIEPAADAIRIVHSSRAKLQSAEVITDEGAGQIPMVALVLECNGPGSDGAHALGFWLELEAVADLVANLQAALT
jgi:hypothetical protein